MKPSLQKLYKFIKLEAERGYDNRAIVGGLERVLDWWTAEARLEGVSEELIQMISSRLHDYPRLSEYSRYEFLEGMWKRVQGETNAPVLNLIPPKPPQKLTEKESESLTADAAQDLGQDEDAEGAEPDEIMVLSQTAAPEPSPQAEKPAEPLAHPPARLGPPPALDAPVTVLTGVGPKNAAILGRLGLNTLYDMLYNFPRRYDDYSRLKPINRLVFGEEVTVIGTVQSVSIRPRRNGTSKMVEALLSDGTAAMRLYWFSPYQVKRLQAGAQISVSGKVNQYLGRLVMNNPQWEALEQQHLSTMRIVPVYRLSGNISQQWLRKLMSQVVSHWAPRMHDPITESTRRRADLLELTSALQQAHLPDSWEQLNAARQRLAFDEIFLLQLGVLRQKREWQSRSGRVFDTPADWLEEMLQGLPFSLTNAQQRVLADVRDDLGSGHPMNRLLQGDVGSGKTIIAALAIAMVTRHGSQAALMAPTGILAEQHFRNLQNILTNRAEAEGDEEGSPPAPILLSHQVRLMVGATPEAEKAEIRAGLENGEIKLVIGTHALIEEPVIFADLELTIVDEQHRFGVDQRAILRSKGTNPHLLVMTATPIPRSLALTVYGDLDLSVIDEMPPGRQAVITYVLTPYERERVYRLIRSQVEAGRQAFVIYPLVEEGEKTEAEGEPLAAVEEYARLQEKIFPQFKLGLLHGRMKADDKDDVMQRFRNGEFQILVSTSVVEVGVDIPNATVMLIEGANRFGLAQLHQLRGRVGRGGEKSYCLLVAETTDAVENERLQVMLQTNDGFVLAEHDLQQRGPGDFLGKRQSGYNDLKLASLTDVHLIDKARRMAQENFEVDPELKSPEYQLLASFLERSWSGNRGDIS